MDKESVIAFREALTDGGKHRAVRLLFDNGINVSLSSDIVFWDDDNERIVAFTSDGRSGAFEAGTNIRVICSTYNNIQFIEANTGVKIEDEYANNYKLEDLETMMDNLKSVIKITDEQKKEVISWYSKVYSPNYVLARNAYLPNDRRRGKDMVKTKEKE